MERAVAWGPASLSNFGPGFDIIGLAIDGWGDRIEATVREDPGVEVSYPDTGVWRGPTDPLSDTAGVAAAKTLELIGWDGGVRLSIEKGVVPGSGVGSSAASSVAGAWAVNLLFGAPLSKVDLVDAVLEGETVASGTVHGDNVLPALFGGMVIVSTEMPTEYRCISIPDGLHLAIVLPDIRILTREARAILPATVPLDSAIRNASNLAIFVDAVRDGDWPEVGKRIMMDRIVEPVRSSLLPCYDSVRTAALSSGALGCALSGSGPAMFALADSVASSLTVLASMEEAVRLMGISVVGLSAQTDPVGTREAEVRK